MSGIYIHSPPPPPPHTHTYYDVPAVLAFFLAKNLIFTSSIADDDSLLSFSFSFSVCLSFSFAAISVVSNDLFRLVATMSACVCCPPLPPPPTPPAPPPPLLSQSAVRGRERLERRRGCDTGVQLLRYFSIILLSTHST